MAASASASSSSSSGCYNVFINHRGVDVKKTFASHLYRRLQLHGFRVFLDQPELREGESLTCQIQGAIITASVHVAIFSPRYAESKWCLDELIFMLESKAPIIPVFYGVKPAELRSTGGKYGVYAQALDNLEKKKTHEEKLRYDSNTIEKWRKALCDVAEISGFDLQEACNGDEGELVEKIVQRLLKLVQHTLMSVAKYPTGLNEKVEDIETTILLKQQQQIGKAHVVGIVGMGGIGKTTLAKELFNRKNSDYSRSCFLSDVRENASKTSLIFLQSKLLKGLTQLDIQIEHIGEGINRLKDHLSFSRTLIILDDVDHADQLDALLPLEVKHVLRSDSLILITTRDKNVLTRSGVDDSSIYKLTGLNTQHSRELFCLYAFSERHPLPGFEYLVDDFLRACDGLPLSLIVFGALLYGNKDKSYWEDQLERILIPGDILQKLKISYDALNREEQQIFLDIACFFIGEMRDMAIKIWDGSGLKGLLGFQNLVNKCLVVVDNQNFIKMHHHIRDLGRDIAEDPGLPLRLWRPIEKIDDLMKQLSEISVRGIRMAPCVDSDDVQYEILRSDMPWYKRKSHELFLNRGTKLRNTTTRFSGVGRTKLQFIDTEDALLGRILRRVQSPNLVWLSWSKCPYSSLPSWIPMENLRVLQVAGRELKTLWQGQLQAPLQLRELRIIAPLSKIPKSIGKLTHLERIAIIYPPRLPVQIKLKRMPKEFCHLPSLKSLVLRGCSRIKSLPSSFGDLTSLEHINLSGSSNLEILPNSFGNLIRLKYLDLNGCSNLTISEGTFGNIRALEYINLSNCEKIQLLPSQVAHQRSLENLYLRNTKLREMPIAIGNLSYLEILELGSPLLETLPSSIGDLRNLKELTLWNCKELKSLEDSVGLLDELTKLRVGFCPLSELPFKMDEGETEEITEPRGRRTSSNLDSSIDKCMFRLQHLELFFTKISKVSFPEGAFPNLQHLLIRFAYDLVEVGTLPNTLIQLELIGCCNLRKLEGLCGLPKLQSLNIGGCKKVEQLPSIETLVSLQELWAYECVKLKGIRGLAQLTKLRKLDASDCSELEELEGVEHLRSLQKLHTYGCPQLQWGWGVLEQLRQRLTKEGMLVL